MDGNTQMNRQSSRYDQQKTTGNNARRISYHLNPKQKKQNSVVATPQSKKQDSSVLNLKREQRQNTKKELAQEFISDSDIFDEKIDQSNKKKIDEKKLKMLGPANREEAIETAQEVYREKGLAENTQLIESLRKGHDYIPDVPSKPSFPIIIFTFAVMKDVIEIFLVFGSVTIVLFIIAEILSALFGIFIFIWLIVRQDYGNSREFDKNIKFALGVLFIEETPIIQALPTEALFVWWVHHKEKRNVKKEKEAIQRLKELRVIRQ